jgi:hypothetical protein
MLVNQLVLTVQLPPAALTKVDCGTEADAGIVSACSGRVRRRTKSTLAAAQARGVGNHRP